ncbi:MAG: response regulator [Anaerolineae bacterium]|nr:response regulator [Anaerolineae bacterium]
MTQQSKILIIDDQRTAQKSLEMLLTPEGYQLVFAGSGAEALTKAAQVVPDLILLDVMMPGMDGFEVCRRLRAHPLLAEVPIIMITALDDRDSRLQGIAAGADDFVTKPFDSVELRARVKSITRLNRYRRLLVERVRFRWVVERADEGFLLIDDGDRVLYANPRARLYLNLPEGDEPIGVPFTQLVRNVYRCEPQEAWGNWPQQPAGGAPRYLVRPETPTAQAFWLQVDVLNLPGGPDMAGVVRLREVIDQMNALRDIRGFNVLITQKLRTPISTVVSSLDMLARYYQETVSQPDVADLFATAYRGGRRLNQQIDDILHYLRDLPVLAKTGEAFGLAQLDPLVAQIGQELGLKAVAVNFEGCPGDARVVLSDRAMELVLREVLENARKFHPQNAPTVDVYVSCATAKEVSLHVHEDGTTVEKRERITAPTTVCLRISDDGLTLSPDQLARVWTPYYQAEKHFTGEVAGMGLGLTMVATLVWSVGGAARLYNLASGPGVVVELTLPLA